MPDSDEGLRLRIFIHESLRHSHIALYKYVRGMAQREGLAGVTVFLSLCLRSSPVAASAPGVNAARAKSSVNGAKAASVCSFSLLTSSARWSRSRKESAGKRSPVGTGKGNPYLRSALIEAAKAAGRTKHTYLASQYHRLAARRGKNRAAVAVAHTILVIVYHVLKEGTPYQDLGPQYFDERDKAQIIRRSVARIEALGKHVVLEDAA